MKNILKNTATIFCFLLVGFSYMNAQDKKAWLQEVLTYEKASSNSGDTSLENKNIALSYVVKSTNWDDETSVSNVRMYKKKEQMNFFSEQVSIYQDRKEAYIILPAQKIIIINSTVQQNKSSKIGDDFFEMRKAFLDSCEIVRCEVISPISKNKILVLRNKLYDEDDAIKINTMTYEFNSDQKKIISIKMDYNEGFKIKHLVMIFKDFNTNSNYQFISPKRVIVDKNGNLLPRYQSYELVDNRDNATQQKKVR
jgi:hypothetical protein